MATVTKSAATSVTKLFGAVTTTADAITTAIGVVGNAFDVLNVKSTDWLEDTRKLSAATAEEREVAIIDDVTFAIATRLMEREKAFVGNPQLKAAYDAALVRVEAAVARAKGQDQQQAA